MYFKKEVRPEISLFKFRILKQVKNHIHVSTETIVLTIELKTQFWCQDKCFQYTTVPLTSSELFSKTSARTETLFKSNTKYIHTLLNYLYIFCTNLSQPILLTTPHLLVHEFHFKQRGSAACKILKIIRQFKSRISILLR